MIMAWRTLAIAGIGAGAIGCAASAATQTYDLDGFTKVETSAGVKVELTQADAFSIEAEGSERAIERLAVSVRGDTLELGRVTNNRWNRGNYDEVTVMVTMPDVEGLGASSAGEIDAEMISAGDLKLAASSGARVVARGACERLNADASSGGRVDAGALPCDDVDADASSGGSITVFARESVDASASSGGSIVVDGQPTDVESTKSSGGSVRIRN